MRPEDNRPATPIVVPSRQSTPLGARPASSDAAADLVRGQIDSIYHQDPHATMPAAQPVNPSPEPTVATEMKPSTTAHAPGPGAVNMKLLGNIQADNQQANAANPYERTHDLQQHQIQSSSWQKVS